MDDRIKPTYDLYMEKISVIELEVAEKNKQLISYKNIINQLLVDGGEQPQFSEISMQLEPLTQPLINIPDNTNIASMQSVSVKIGEFYHKPLAKSIRIILQRKGSAMLFSDIQEALLRGGADAKDAQRLRLLMLKSNHFDLLPDKQHFILVPKEKQKKIKKVGESEKIT